MALETSGVTIPPRPTESHPNSGHRPEVEIVWACAPSGLDGGVRGVEVGRRQALNYPWGWDDAGAGELPSLPTRQISIVSLPARSTVRAMICVGVVYEPGALLELAGGGATGVQPPVPR